MEGSPVVAAARGVGAFLHGQEFGESDEHEGKRGGRLAPAARRLEQLSGDLRQEAIEPMALGTVHAHRIG
jgi:hypothetical protein